MKTLVASIVFVGLMNGQAPPNPTQKQVVYMESTPVYRVTVVSRSTNAVNYRHRSGATKVNFAGTPLMPKSRGEAKVESKKGYIEIEVEFDDMVLPQQFGPEFLTYVLWAISPEGRATNMGEILLNNEGEGKLNVTTELQSFGMIVTAEPYFAVSQPSDVVVMENTIRPDTTGKIEVVEAKYELLKRGSYAFNADQSALRPMTQQPATPIYLWEARNAVQIARWAGADKHAGDTFRKAESQLRQAEDYYARKQDKPMSMTAREAVQTAEDARLIALQRIEEARLAAERQAAADREAEARAKAEEANRQKQIEAERLAAAEADRLSAERERLAAERAKADAEVARAQALAQQQQLAQEAERARQAAAAAERARLNAEAEQGKLRQQLLQQFNSILETRESARGLIVNMSDVLFDTAKWTLKPGAREKLAKISGIILSHPGLKIEVEGHTDSVGSDEYNQHLSEQRASSVRDYLAGQGVSTAKLTAKGFGESRPVASNDHAAGRQQNRRVELVVSGDIIGTEVSRITTTTSQQ